MRHATLLLLAALLTSPARADGPAPAPVAAAYARPLHRLTEAGARRLNGRRCLWYVRVKDLAAYDGDWVLYDCESPDPKGGGGRPAATQTPRVARSAWLRRGQAAAVEMVVEATLRVYRWRGPAFPEEVEYRLLDTVRK